MLSIPYDGLHVITFGLLYDILNLLIYILNNISIYKYAFEEV